MLKDSIALQAGASQQICDLGHLGAGCEVVTSAFGVIEIDWLSKIELLQQMTP